MGIEPTSQAWEARILPLYYARKEALNLSIPFSLVNVHSAVIASVREAIQQMDCRVVRLQRTPRNNTHSEYQMTAPTQRRCRMR